MLLPRWFSALLAILWWPCRALYRWIGRLRDDPGAPYRHGAGTWRLPPVPADCPNCNGALVYCAARDEWVCAGVIGRAEVVRRLGARLAKLRLMGVTDVPPCGFAGRAADYGTKWA